MTKFLAPTFATIVLGTTYYGAIAHGSIMSFTLDTSQSAALIRACLTVLVCLYFFKESLRTPAANHLLRAIGIGLLGFGLTGLLTDQLATSFNYYMLPLDVFFAIEGGVIALLLSLELPLAPAKSISKRPITGQLPAKEVPALST